MVLKRGCLSPFVYVCVCMCLDVCVHTYTHVSIQKIRKIKLETRRPLQLTQKDSSMAVRIIIAKTDLCSSWDPG